MHDKYSMYIYPIERYAENGREGKREIITLIEEFNFLNAAFHLREAEIIIFRENIFSKLNKLKRVVK